MASKHIISRLGLALGLALGQGVTPVQAQAEVLALEVSQLSSSTVTTNQGVDVAPASGSDLRQRLEAMFAEGMEALEDNRLRSAIGVFSNILGTNNNLHRARLELAVAYYRALNYAEARRLAESVLNDPTTPQSVRVTITAFLAQIKAEEQKFTTPHEWKRHLSFGVMRDTNVNLGPGSDFVNIDGVLRPVVDGGQLGDNALYYSAGFSHRYNPGRIVPMGEQNGQLFWQSEASLYHRDYDRYGEDFNLTVLHAATGPAWVLLKRWRGAINLNADYVWLGDSRLASFVGIEPVSTWQFTNGELTLDAELSQRRYDKAQDQRRDGLFFNYGGLLSLYFADRQVVGQFGLHYGRFDADGEEFSNSVHQQSLGLLGFAGRDTRLYARFVQRFYDYDGVPAGFTRARNERERRWLLGIEYDFMRDAASPRDKWTLNVNVNRTFNDSNLDVFEYDRTQLFGGISRTF